MTRQKYLTRKDTDVGVGEYDSIAWAFEVHLRQPDRPELKFAVLHGNNEDAPEYIDFYTQEGPSYFDVPALTWRAEGQGGRLMTDMTPVERALAVAERCAKLDAEDAKDDPLAECRRLLEDAQEKQDAYWDALSALERALAAALDCGEVDIDSDDISEGQTIEELIEDIGLKEEE